MKITRLSQIEIYDATGLRCFALGAEQPPHHHVGAGELASQATNRLPACFSRVCTMSNNEASGLARESRARIVVVVPVTESLA